MKGKLLVSIFIFIIFATGCSKEIHLDNHTNFGIISTIKSDSIINGSPRFDEIHIFEDFESYKEYYYKFLEVNDEIVGLEEFDFENNNIILYNTIIDKERGGEVFHIEEIRIYSKKIKIYITSSRHIKAVEEVIGEYYNYTDIVEIDKNLIPEKYEIIVVND